jgi:hypothetical protein
MLVDERQLHWLGIDMRSRERRRLAVVATYAAFLVVVWVHPPRTYEVVLSLWFLSLFSGMGVVLEDSVSTGVRRLLVVLAVLAAGWFVWAHPSGRGNDSLVMQAEMYAAYLMAAGSVVGWNKLVEPSGRGWMARAVGNPGVLSRREQRRLARRGFAVGLDGIAWYEYGMRFRSLTEEQKLEIEQLHGANPRGKWMRSFGAVLFDDERMRHEDDQLRARVQRIMSGLLIVSALVWYGAEASDWTVRTETVAKWGWTLAVLSVTLRQAVALWNEEDPIEMSGEIRLAEREA